MLTHGCSPTVSVPSGSTPPSVLRDRVLLGWGLLGLLASRWCGARAHVRRVGGTGLQLVDAKADHPVGDVQRSIELRDQLHLRGVELEQVVVGCRLVVDLIGQGPLSPLVL